MLGMGLTCPTRTPSFAAESHLPTQVSLSSSMSPMRRLQLESVQQLAQRPYFISGRCGMRSEAVRAHVPLSLTSVRAASRKNKNKDIIPCAQKVAQEYQVC